MDKKKFQELLTQYADWQTIDEGEQGTQQITVTAVKCQGEHCSDCDQWCPNGRQMEYRIMRSSKGRSFVRPTCITCNRHQDPYTKQFGITGTEASALWFSYVRYDTDRRYKPKAQKKSPPPQANIVDRVIEDDHTKITFFHHKTKSE
jgi:hypothetical protein